MKIKLTLSVTLFVIFALLSSDIVLTQIPLIFTPRARGEDEEYEGTQVAAGTYGPEACPDIEPSLTAFVPGDGKTKTSFRSTTAKSEPTFWFYIPSPSNSQLSAEFRLVNYNTGKDIHNQTYNIQPTDRAQTDIFQIRLSPEVLKEFNTNYYWSFRIICNPNQRDLDLLVDGHITRVQEKNECDLSRVPAREPEDIFDAKAICYAQQGLWHETLTTLISKLCPLDQEKAELRMNQLLQPELGEKWVEQYVMTIRNSRYCKPNSSQ